MREQILKLKAIGRMPTESDADDNDEKIDELIEQAYIKYRKTYYT